MLQYTQELIDFFTIMDIAFPLIIFNHYRRGVEAIVASSKKEIAHSHFVVVGFDGVG
jgi:hypothetical protein